MFLRLFAMAVLFGGVAVGCVGPLYVALDSGSSDAATPTGSLTLTSSSSLTLRPGQSSTIDVRLVDALGTPQAGIVVATAIEGAALDSTLGALSVTTDGDGTAHAILVAGASASSFRVRLSAREAVSAVYVDVGVGTSFGSLLVHAPYTGMRPVTRRVIDVVPGTTCAALSAMPPTSGGRTVRTLDGDVTITALPTTLTYAVLVRANGELALEASGCVEGIVPTQGSTTTVSVALAEVPLGLVGGYRVRASLDASGWIDGRIQTWATSMRTTAVDGGGDATTLLNAIEAELVRRGASSDATQLHALRMGGAIDDMLAAQLTEDGTAPTEVMASLLEEAGAALDTPTLTLTLTLGVLETGSLTTESLECSNGRSGTILLVRAAPTARTISTTTTLDASFDLSAPVDTQVGSLALAWIDAAASDRAHVHGIAGLLSNLCTSLETFAATGDGLMAFSACDATCRAAACTGAITQIMTTLAGGAALVDADIDHIQIAATVSARDDDGDARVDRLDAMIADGQIVSASGASVGPPDAVSGTLTGTRASVP